MNFEHDLIRARLVAFLKAYSTMGETSAVVITG